MQEAASPSPYDPIARLYNRWSASVVEDIAFYVGQAIASGGPVLELGVGTGRIAIPTAAAGVKVVGVDSSAGMLEMCRAGAAAAGVSELLDLRLGDLRRPPVEGLFPLITCPFRALLHLHDDAERLAALRTVHSLLPPGGRFVFDAFAPSREDIEATHGRWLERELEIHERADWDAETRTLVLSVRGAEGESSMELSWLPQEEWQTLLVEAGFAIEGCDAWFDGTPYHGGEDVVFRAVAQ